MQTIVLNGKTFYFDIKPKFISSIRLKLISPVSFEISCPHLTPTAVIRRFILNNSVWIIKHSSKLSPTSSLLNLSSISILGHEYKFIISKTYRDSVVISNDTCSIHLNTSLLSESHVKKLLSTRLKKYADALIKSELRSLQSQFHFKYGRVTLRNQKTRFGSCSSQGNLNFNWQIIFFPTSQFRHILLHEAAHLTHHNHSKKFWQLLSIYDPDWKANNHWLKKEGSKRFLIP